STTNLSRNCNNIVLKFDFEILVVPKITFSNDTSCVENQIKLINSSTGYNSFYWEDNYTKEIDSINDTIIKSYKEPGDYQINLIVKNDVCGQNEISVAKLKILPNNITINQIPLVEHCEPKLDTLILKTNNKADKFTWSFSRDFSSVINTNSKDSILVYQFNKSTELFYKVENKYCYKIDSLEVHVNNSDLKLNNKSFYCQHTLDTISVNVSNSSDHYTFNWESPYSFTGSKNNDTIFFLADKSDKIIFSAISDKGCKLTDTIQINLFSTSFNQINLTATPKTILKGESTTLEEKSNNYSYTWFYKNDSILGNENSIIVKPEKSVFYTLKVNQDKCSISDTIHVNVIEDWICDFPYIFVPNAFSPNNDGENDTLYVRGRPAYQIEFRIYNRWGENVFYSNDLKKGWDGTYKGEKLPPDVYDYYLIVYCIDDVKKQIQGNITLLK
ncbi:MAG: gliding motility-associated C-terminal domain-containing protein, partial [Crocinitomicaceae bacterium]